VRHGIGIGGTQNSKVRQESVTRPIVEINLDLLTSLGRPVILVGPS
jgi:hypothetical protein